MPDRIFPSDKPMRLVRGRKATIRARINRSNYLVDFFDGVGGTEVAQRPDGVAYARGTIVRAHWANEGGVWIIDGQVGTSTPFNFALLAVPIDTEITQGAEWVNSSNEYGRFAPSPNQIANLHTAEVSALGMSNGLSGADDSAPVFEGGGGGLGDCTMFYWLCQYVDGGTATLPDFTAVSGVGDPAVIASISFDGGQRLLSLLTHDQEEDSAANPSVVSVSFNETQTVTTWGVSAAPNTLFDVTVSEQSGEGDTSPVGSWSGTEPWALIRCRVRER